MGRHCKGPRTKPIRRWSQPDLFQFWYIFILIYCDAIPASRNLIEALVSREIANEVVHISARELRAGVRSGESLVLLVGKDSRSDAALARLSPCFLLVISDIFG